MQAFSRPPSRGLAMVWMLAAAVLSGCGAARMGNMWRDESFQTAGMKNVLVVALRGEPVRRRLWEDSIASGLAAYGTKATASYELWANALPDTQQVTEAVRRHGYDGVIVSTRPTNGQEQVIVSGYSRREAIRERDPFTGVYYTHWKDVQVPERIETVAVANFRTDVWTTGDGARLVWSGMSHTTDGVDAATIRHQVKRMILPELSKAAILAKKSGR